ncbi:MAG: ABC transporter substrate-binding protein [Rhodobacterales bacterium]|nr:ABC transporter substrate-binding protein [Rhodobacterales bacterium]
MICSLVLVLAWILPAAPRAAAEEPPLLADAVAAGTLPPMAQRLPAEPSVAHLAKPGRYGGTLRLLMGRSKDTRMMVVYGYARLVGYDTHFDLVPDILADVQVEDGRIFTLKLRKGHKWSDGHPFTSEDFRYFWEDVANDPDLSPTGVPAYLRVNGKPPTFEVIDETTVRYAWEDPNPLFLPLLAGARPTYIYMPAHYLKPFHKKYVDEATLQQRVEADKQRNWVALQTNMGHMYKNANPDLPSLQPWVLETPPPSNRFIFKRNPYFHRVDDAGRQLPYIDEVHMTVASGGLIPTKVGTGDSDLQARHLSFSNYTFLKKGEKRNGYHVGLWRTAKGAHIAIFPNLNAEDPVWRDLLRKADFRRALSLAINRKEVNQVLYFGLALEGANTVQPQSPLYKKEYATAWTAFDMKKAGALLDGLGLTQRDPAGLRLLPDGRPMEVIVETAGEDSEQADVLELIHDSWLKLGIKLHTKPLQREVFRNRVFAGSTLFSVWFGLENGVPTADLSPQELAPTDQQQLQWPKWGQYYQTNGKAGEPPDLPEAETLLALNNDWLSARTKEERTRIWHDMLKINADQVFSIGVVSGVRQPVVVNTKLRNVPKEGVYNWDPGAHFGIYRPDTFWFAK